MTPIRTGKAKRGEHVEARALAEGDLALLDSLRGAVGGPDR
jgi:hypothetical protein